MSADEWPPRFPEKRSPFPLVLWRFHGTSDNAVECRILEHPDADGLELRVEYHGELMESHVHRDNQLLLAHSRVLKTKLLEQGGWTEEPNPGK